MDKGVSLGFSFASIMYHYVRPVASSEFPRLQALEVEKFKSQLNYIRKNYRVVDIGFLLSLIESGESPREHLALLTFDDGFSDHYNFVFPILTDFGLSGCFYPCADPVMNRSLLDVHKIQFILESNKDIDSLVQLCRDMELNYGINPAKRDFKGDVLINDKNRSVAYVKRMLQRDLPIGVRKPIVSDLFKEIVKKDEFEFANELYLSLDQITEMKQAGMHIGAHGCSHEWLASMSFEGQSKEIDKSLEMLSVVGVDVLSGWTMAYPYGNYNEDTLDLLRQRRCSLAFLDSVGGTMPNAANKYSLDRIDTINFPFS